MENEALANGDAVPTIHPPNPPARLNDHLAESLRLEHQLMRVPFEHLKKSMRTSNRTVEKEMNAVMSGVAEAAQKDMSKEEAVQHLNSLVSRLQGLKRKLDESNKSEQLQVQRCRARLDHLTVLRAENQQEWNNIRVNRILVDYMLRLSYYDTAMKLAENSAIQDLVDINVFMDAKKVVECLQNRDCAPALAWCAENKSKLKKVKSKLEFQLRLQEFIELVRVDHSMDAIQYARKHLAPWGSTNMKELQHAMATLAFRSNTDCATYKPLVLFDRFREENEEASHMGSFEIVHVWIISYLPVHFENDDAYTHCQRSVKIRDEINGQRFSIFSYASNRERAMKTLLLIRLLVLALFYFP